MLDDRIPSCRAIKYFVIFGIDAIVFTNYDIDVQIGIDKLFRGVGIIRAGQDNVTVATHKVSLQIIADMNRKPLIRPEVAQLMSMGSPGTRLPMHISASRS